METCNIDGAIVGFLVAGMSVGSNVDVGLAVGDLVFSVGRS